MKTFIAKAEMCTYLQVRIRARTQEEAEEKAQNMCGSAFSEIDGTGSWEVYNVEEE
ncbi:MULTISPECIES: hypothetical protein [Roseivirga]|jgi:hypothetical protein|uniref:hypothetical protein n=1 Tax=Roseivirga TaxID=290180 RepID=UPI000B2D2ACB|nr:MULTISPECIES: hypothetical protein [Roseivirga]MBO6496585.1 hypothetical protein [Roseivirga sp.]MBO6662680.1 hypothetical protein [Roseivirga sp.]MBO6759807.1 hypothetical protein [Roseivirga sp.]MBO6909687.1 hypothetical protein [Roseivirga sp.]WPZ10936.1 hypothetical protein T7867_02345 [Roseivirga spongicola]